MLAVSYPQTELWEGVGGADSEALFTGRLIRFPQPPYFIAVRKESAEVDAAPLPRSSWLERKKKEKGRTVKRGEFLCGKLCVTSIFNTAVLAACESLNAIGNPAIERNKGGESWWTYLSLSHVWSHATHTYTVTQYVLLTPQAGSVKENNRALMSFFFPVLAGPTGPITAEENTTWQMAASWLHIKMKSANNARQRGN